MRMRMPNFTAAASVYKTGEHYRLGEIQTETEAGASAVIPAQSRRCGPCRWYPALHHRYRVCCPRVGLGPCRLVPCGWAPLTMTGS